MQSSSAFLSVLVLGPKGTGRLARGTSLKRRRTCLPQLCFYTTRNIPTATTVQSGAKPSDELLEQFAAAVTGEWKGYEGQFDSGTGKIKPIPDYYIPEQFLEWDLTPRGFETNHSVIVRDTRLFRKFFRILPTVSLFADHVDYEEDFTVTQLNEPEISDATSTALFADGSFVSGPGRVVVRRESRLDKWPSAVFSLQDARDNMRRAANVWLRFNFENRSFVDDIRVVVENRSCDYCDGADLEGSSGFVDGWVSLPPGDPAQLKGEWAIHSANTTDSSNDSPSGGASTTIERRTNPIDADVALFLPNGIDLSISGAENDDGIIVRVGWLVDYNTRIVLCRHFQKDGAVVMSQRLVEQRLS